MRIFKKLFRAYLDGWMELYGPAFKYGVPITF